MGFQDFLHNPDRYSAKSRAPELEDEPQENYEETPMRTNRVQEFEEDDQMSRDDRRILDEVDFFKQRLYKKIDSCFLRYGLEGLKRIDEGIASSIAKYIDGLKGGNRFEERQPVREGYTPNFRRPPERVRYRDEELDESRDSLPPPQPKPAPKLFKKPQRIEGSNPNPAPARRPGEPNLESSSFNPELLNAILTDVIPPTEIHEVEIKSNIPRPDSSAQHVKEKVDFAPLPEQNEEDVLRSTSRAE